MRRADYIFCVTDEANKGKAWCGRSLIGWNFVDIDHAAMHGRKQGRLLVCPECRASIVSALSMDEERAEEEDPYLPRYRGADA